MDPLQHMSLLREIGVDWYAPRDFLAINPLSLERVHITLADEVKPPVEAQAVGVSKSTQPVSIKVKPIIDFGFDSQKSKPIAEALVVAPGSKTTPVVKSVIAPFNLLVVSGEYLVFVVDIKISPLSAVWERSVRQFFDEIELACGSSVNRAQSIDYFSWPIAGNTSMSLGEDQLIQLLAGFMRPRISDDVKGIVLFGDNANQYSTSVFSSKNNAQVITVPGLAAMFTSFSAKASLWKDLQVFKKGNS
jgi:hypothetical protein